MVIRNLSVKTARICLSYGKVHVILYIRWALYISKHFLASHFEQFCAASSIFRWGCLFYVPTPEMYPPIRPDLVFLILHNTSVHTVVSLFSPVKLPSFCVLFAVLRRKWPQTYVGSYLCLNLLKLGVTYDLCTKIFLKKQGGHTPGGAEPICSKEDISICSLIFHMIE